jgi:hypothetical protein
MTGAAASDAPRWLADEPALQALLYEVLDRFDRQPGEHRQRDVLLTAAVAVQDLLHSDARADQLWHCIEDLQQLGVLKIRRPRHSKLDPYAAPWQHAKLAFAPDCETILRAWLDRPRSLTAVQAWRQAVQQLSVFTTQSAWLQERPIMMAGRSAAEVLIALAAAQDIFGPITLRQLSARLFWGDSKVLDERGELVATLFPHLVVRERAIVVSVWLPTRYGGVLFIENQDTYTAACQGHLRVDDMALVYAAGFRTAASRIRQIDGVLLHYAGSGVALQPGFEAWWFGQSTVPDAIHADLRFWGDLDFAGMQILKSLRERFGDVRAWQPGYAPMLARLQQGGHAREAAQFDVGATGCDYADSCLLPAIRQWGRLDQEFI